jgi:hypothetical protein
VLNQCIYTVNATTWYNVATDPLWDDGYVSKRNNDNNLGRCPKETINDLSHVVCCYIFHLGCNRFRVVSVSLLLRYEMGYINSDTNLPELFRISKRNGKK